MNNKYVFIAAKKGLTTARNNINSKFMPDEDLLAQYLSIWIEEDEIPDLIKQLNTRGWVVADSNKPYVAPVCIKIMTVEYMEKLI